MMIRMATKQIAARVEARAGKEVEMAYRSRERERSWRKREVAKLGLEERAKRRHTQYGPRSTEVQG